MAEKWVAWKAVQSVVVMASQMAVQKVVQKVV
jgi:hypothetical protein